MLSKIKENETAFYNILGMFIVNGCNLFSILFFAKVMGAANFGIYSIYNSWMLLLYPVLCYQVGSTLNIVYGKIDEVKFSAFSTAVFQIAVILGGSMVVLVCFFSPKIAVWIHFPVFLVILLALHAFSYSLIDFVYTDLIYRHRAKKRCVIMSLLSISTTLISVGLTYFWPTQDKYLGRIYGTAFPYVFLGAFLVINRLFKEKVSLNLITVKFCIFKGAPVIAHTLSHNIMHQSDRIVMELCNIEETAIGIYSFIYSFCTITNALLSAFAATWIPIYLEHISKKNRYIKIRIKSYVGFFSTILCGFILLSREVCTYFADVEYHQGVEIIPVIVFSTAFIFLYQFSVDFEFNKGKTIIISLMTFLAALFNVLANFWLVPSMGYFGAAFTTLLAYGLMFALHYLVCLFFWKDEFPLEFSTVLKCICSLFFACFFFYFLSDNPLLRWIIGATLGIIELLKIWKRKTLF